MSFKLSDKEKIKNNFKWKKIKTRNKNGMVGEFCQKMINLIIFIFIIFITCFKECTLSMINFHSSNITIKIKESGMQNILFYGDCYITSVKYDMPDEIYINNEKQIIISTKYDFERTDNTIKLVWYEARENWGCLFKGCNKITEMDFSEFDFSKIIRGNMMFMGCKALTSINMNDFGPVKLKDAGSFFRELISLTSLDLSNFDMSEVSDIGWMFAGSTSLTSLDLSSFHSYNITVKVTHLFWNCPKLEYINLKDEAFPIKNDSQFMSAKKNFVICNQDEKIIEEVQKYGCPTIDCSENWRQKQKKINMENGECVDDCSLTNYKYNYNNECYENCPNKTYINNHVCLDCHPDCETCEKSADIVSTNCKSCSDHDKYLNIGNCVYECTSGNYLDENNIKVCKCDLVKCDKCSKESYEQNLCLSCNNGYYPKFDDINNDNSFIDCYQSIEGYYLDSGFFKSCYESCKTCNRNGNDANHNCIECKNNYNYEINSNNYKNCYTFNQNENNIYIDNYSNFNNILDNIIDNILDSYSPETENNLVIKRPDEVVYHISNSKNELELLKNKSNNINNISIIDLGQCETRLREVYHINETDSLLIVKNEISSNKPSEKNLNFEVYEPINKKKLNLSFCDNTSINVYVPMELSKETKQLYDQMKESGFDMFNINDPFYQDICTPFDSPDGTDILLSDRINYIYNNDDTQCQPNCQFSLYSIESQYMECSCSTNENANYENLNKNTFSTKKIYESFYDVLKYSNYDILKCHKIITNIKALKSNIGCMITIIYFCCYLIGLFIYICKGIDPLRKKLEKILKKKKANNITKKNSNIDNIFYPPKKKKATPKLFVKVNKKNMNKIIFNKIDFSSQSNIKNNKQKIYSISGSKNNVLVNPKFNEINIKKLKHNGIKPKNIKQIIYSDYELNELEYKEAVKLDKRSLFQIYWATLKREHLIFFTFCSCDDYNLFSIKLTRFVFLIVGDMALNTFFFSDDSMHKLFLNYGKYNFIQQIPQITYSTIISLLIEVFLCYLSLTDKYFYLIKTSFMKGNKEEIKKIIKCIKIKLVMFFIFVFIFFVLYWYIISVFCGVYRNTQITFIKDSVLSFSICLIYPLILYFISASLRICSLKNRKASCKCIYSLSYMIPFF